MCRYVVVVVVAVVVVGGKLHLVVAVVFGVLGPILMPMGCLCQYTDQTNSML